ncbi:MAG: hypothetical protein RL172_103 [Bacteroidota bacterium]|jgi:hypothetical protein
MKKILFALLVCVALAAKAQQPQNIIIITTDGFRWQEVFAGMDSCIANNPLYNQGDSAAIYNRYWHSNPLERRKKLLPFLWSVVQSQGRLYGNRQLQNFVNNKNRYWFSYPGYNEIFTGYPDTLINSNNYPPNPHTNLLEFLNKQPHYKGNVAAFGAWNAFERILNKQRSGITLLNAFDSINTQTANATQKVINKMLQDSYKPFGQSECLDVFTHYAAMEHLANKTPRVLYIAYGETDEWAHHGHYRDYLDAAHQVDAWIKEIWQTVQAHPAYKNNTALFITTDHGRGDIIKEQWTSHGADIQGASEIWFAVMAPNIKPAGEITTKSQYYQQQFAQTMAHLIGLHFTCEHPVANQVTLQ